MVDAAFVIVVFAREISGFAVVVEGLRWDVRHVAEAVPLGAALCIQMVDIVIGDTLVKSLDLVLEFLATEGRLKGHIEGEVETGHVASAYLGSSSFDTGRSEEIETANVVIGTPYPGGIIRGAGEAWEVFAGRKGCGVGVEGNSGGLLAHDGVFDLRQAAGYCI